MYVSNVFFLGSLNEAEKNRVIKSCNALVLPSINRSEAFGIALVEGAMFGKALISTELSTGTSFVNQHNFNGFVVKPEDLSELRNAIKKIIDQPELRRKFEKNSRRLYLKHFNAEKMCDEYCQIYNRLTTQNAS